MGTVSPRLRQLYEQVQVGIPLPVLVVTDAAPTVDVQRALQGATGAHVAFSSALSHTVGMQLTLAQAQAAARVPGVHSVQYDEPVGHALGTLRHGG